MTIAQPLKPVFQIRNAATEGTLEVLLYEQIGEDFWSGGGVSAKKFSEALKAAGDVQEINLRINSPGGVVFDGLTIYNALKEHPAKVTVDIDGIAASIASVIAMAGDEIRIAESAMVMIHDAQGLALGNHREMEAMRALLEKWDGQIASVYAARTGRRADTFRKLMDAETWFTAAEAKENGLVDQVIPNKRPTNAWNLARFKNAPQGMDAGAPEDRPRKVSPETVAARLRAIEMDGILQGAAAG